MGKSWKRLVRKKRIEAAKLITEETATAVKTEKPVPAPVVEEKKVENLKEIKSSLKKYRRKKKSTVKKGK